MMTSLDRPGQSASAHRDAPALLRPHDDKPPYRDGTEALRRESACLREGHVAAIEAMRETAGPIYAARCARAAAGRALLAGAVLVVLGILYRALLERGLGPARGSGAVYYQPVTLLLLASWPAAGLFYLLARARARRGFLRRMLAPIRMTGDPHADLERVHRYDPGQHVMPMLAGVEAASLGPLMAGVGALLPLTIHFVVGQTVDAMGYEWHRGPFLAAFDLWIWGSLLATSHCHGILVLRAWRHGKHLAAAPTVSVLALGGTPGWKTYRLLVMLSIVPGFVFGCVLVAITGLFIGPMFGLAARRLAAERNALAEGTLESLAVGSQR